MAQTMPQLIASLALGPLVHATGGNWSVALWWAAACSLMGGLLGWAWFQGSDIDSSEVSRGTEPQVPTSIASYEQGASRGNALGTDPHKEYVRLKDSGRQPDAEELVP